MKLNDIDYSEDINTKITDFENFFTVYEDKRSNYSFNLNETLYLNIDESQLQEYTCTTECFWPLISYILYETTRLAWLLMKINNVRAEEMFEKKMPGDVIKYLPIEQMNSIVEYINAT